MPDWFQDALSASDLAPTTSMAVVRLLLAFGLGLVVAIIYRTTCSNRERMPYLPTTLVLLSVLIALLTLTIGNSLARAFGLVGVLSIVRFRTVIEDTRDTAFVIFAVVVGMAAGAGYAALVAVGVPVVAMASFVMGRAEGALRVRFRLTVRIGVAHYDPAMLEPILRRHCVDCKWLSTMTATQGTLLELVHSVEFIEPESLHLIVKELSRVEGVQRVEIDQP